MSDFFKFEKEGIDFPFYNQIPKISKLGWFLLLLTLPISLLAYAFVGSEFVGSILFSVILLVPLLYLSNWDFKLFFQKPALKELGLAVALFIGYMLYTIVMDYLVLGPTGLGSDSSVAMTINLEVLVSLVFSMLAEELVKFIPFMFLMRVFFKYSGNRKVSMILSAFIVMIGFAFMHYDFIGHGNTIVEVILLQGFGSIFEFYGLIKTKNILISYTTHFLTDFIIMGLVLLGF